MDEEKLDKLRAAQNKALNEDFDLEFKQMISVYVLIITLFDLYFRKVLMNRKKALQTR